MGMENNIKKLKIKIDKISFLNFFFLKKKKVYEEKKIYFNLKDS